MTMMRDVTGGRHCHSDRPEPGERRTRSEGGHRWMEDGEGGEERKLEVEKAYCGGGNSSGLVVRSQPVCVRHPEKGAQREVGESERSARGRYHRNGESVEGRHRRNLATRATTSVTNVRSGTGGDRQLISLAVV